MSNKFNILFFQSCPKLHNSKLFNLVKSEQAGDGRSAAGVSKANGENWEGGELEGEGAQPFPLPLIFRARSFSLLSRAFLKKKGKRLLRRQTAKQSFYLFYLRDAVSLIFACKARMPHIPQPSSPFVHSESLGFAKNTCTTVFQCTTQAIQYICCCKLRYKQYL